ncbi:MAG: hypothetical protein K2M65_04440, partial [Muribaculaceae bacterium]|nr:hypothetical protein [Muribaculaceae bacterium]
MMRRFIFVSIFSIGVGLSAAAQDDASVDSLMRELQEVMVTARQPVTRLVGTSLVSTISGSSLQYLGTALDVLSQLPMIRVEDSGVSVAGKGVPEIYIDGRPMRLSDELTKLQSINIKKIELQLAPGAAYSSDTGAVLKITTRRNFVDGLSVLDRAEVTARRKWSASDLLDLNYRVRNLDLFASAIVGRSNSVIKGSTTNTLEYEDREVIIGSSQYKSYPSTSGAFKAGFNHTSGEQSFGAYFRFGSECGKFANYGTEWIGDESPVVRRIDTRSRDHGTLVSLYYDNTFFGKYHMHFDGDYQHSRVVKDEATTYPNFDLDRVCSDALRHSTLWAGKWYCAVPMAHGKLTAGTQDSYTHTVLNSRMLSGLVSD